MTSSLYAVACSLVQLYCPLAVRPGVLTTVGGITDAFQIYVVPALVYMKMQKNKGIRNRSTHFYHFVFVWGVCLMSFTVGNTLWNMV